MKPIPKIQEYRRGDFLSFLVHDLQNGRFALIAEQRPFAQRCSDTIRIETSTRRLEKLANDILNHLGKKAQWRKWHPTLDELLIRLEQERGEGFGIENWFIDWVRKVVTMKEEKQVQEARRIYEWLHSNRDWLYGRQRT